jgi:RNA polymerase sigma factor (sigma-70 family)
MKVISIFSHALSKDIDSIIAGCRHKDGKCQRLLFNRCAPRVLTTCRRYEVKGLDARDILQETFLAVFEKIAQYDPSKAAIDTWINRIAVNIALKMLNKSKIQWVELSHIPDLADWDGALETDIEDELDEEQILALIQELPLGYRTVFNLYVIDDFSHAEIAKTLEISEQTSKSQLFKAKAMLRQKLATQKKSVKTYYY